MRPEIIVITLKRSTDRQASISKQLNDLGLSFSFFYGIDGHTQTSEVDVFYNDRLRKFFRGDSLSRGQLGCFGSHYRAWVKCFNEGKPLIILEDDTKIIGERFIEFYDLSSTIPERFQCLRLFDKKTKRRKSVFSGAIGGLSIYKYTKGMMSAEGYYLTPSGAEKLIKYTSPILYPVDIYMDRFWFHGVENYGVAPPCIELNESFESVIGYSESPKRRSAYVRLRRELFNFSEKVRRFLHNAFFRLKDLSSKRLFDVEKARKL